MSNDFCLQSISLSIFPTMSFNHYDKVKIGNNKTDDASCILDLSARKSESVVGVKSSKKLSHDFSSTFKPPHSYIGLIAMAILSSADRRMALAEIYEWIAVRYPYFNWRGTGWRNSIRHNLSLNDCFVKIQRATNGKGHYWTIHPANLHDFMRGDFGRKRAQWKVKAYFMLERALATASTDSSLETMES